jgi:flavin-dependent dehydrogenase
VARIQLDLSEPIRIYSRRDLDGFLLEQALRTGARLIPSPAVDYRRDEQGWVVSARDGSRERADILVGADGASSAVRRRMGIDFGPRDMSVTIGCYIPGRFHPGSIYIRFLDQSLHGYLWSFPRVDHLSVGIISLSRELTASELRAHLSRFLADRYGIQDSSGFPGYGALVPTLGESTWKTLRVSGPDWALIGDAAGFVDPLTAEGIYYALRSADLLSRAIEARDLELFHRKWREDFGDDLVRAAAIRERLYRGRLARKPFLSRGLQLAGRSPTVRRMFIELISGRLEYRALRRWLLRQGHRVTLDLFRSALARQPRGC